MVIGSKKRFYTFPPLNLEKLKHCSKRKCCSKPKKQQYACYQVNGSNFSFLGCHPVYFSSHMIKAPGSLQNSACIALNSRTP
jgi:hypothetical protein